MLGITWRIALIFLASFSVSSTFPAKSYVKPNSDFDNSHDLAEEKSGQFEGDIVISPEELDELLKTPVKTGLIDEKYKWHNNTVPYKIKEDDFNSSQIKYIYKAINKLQDVTCLKFIPYIKIEHDNYIFVTGDNTGCHSMVGMRGGRQQLNLQPYDLEVGCFRLYTIAHEFIHALGFYHMQSATKRDNYVKIIWENIQPDSKHNFNKYDSKTISQFEIDYDFESVMHYSETAFSINGQKTIVPRKELQNGIKIGQRNRLSEMDIARINAMYCKKK